MVSEPDPAIITRPPTEVRSAALTSPLSSLPQGFDPVQPVGAADFTTAVEALLFAIEDVCVCVRACVCVGGLRSVMQIDENVQVGLRCALFPNRDGDVE